MPTQQELDNLKTNCIRLTAWVNHLHDYFQDVVNEVYLKVDQEDDYDPMQPWISRVMSFAFDGLSDLEFKGSDTVADVLDTICSSYDVNTPDPLKQAMGDVWARFSATFLQLNDDLGEVIADPAGNWSRVIHSEVLGRDITISDLGNLNVTFPDSAIDPINFNRATDTAVAGFRYNLAKWAIGKKWSILHQPNSNFWSGWNDDDARKFAKDQISGNRDVYLTWWHDQEGSCGGCPNDGIATMEPRIGVGDWYSNWDYYHGPKATKDMCDWLMKDDGFGTILNPGAITTREDVFYNWPIEGNLKDHPDHAVKSLNEKPEASYEFRERAKKWRHYLSRNSRRDVEAAIVQRAVDDPKFLYDLKKDPKATLTAHLGIEVPDEVNIEVIQEKPGDYKLVIPYIGRPARSSKAGQ